MRYASLNHRRVDIITVLPEQTRRTTPGPWVNSTVPLTPGHNLAQRLRQMARLGLRFSYTEINEYKQVRRRSSLLLLIMHTIAHSIWFHDIQRDLLQANDREAEAKDSIHSRSFEGETPGGWRDAISQASNGAAVNEGTDGEQNCR